MASLISHPAPVVALSVAYGTTIIPKRLIMLALFASVAPDLDVLSFSFGVQYAEALGHRGLSHSLLFALGFGFFAFLIAPLLRAKRTSSFLVVTFIVISHIFLDAITTGGLGVAFFWPFDETRYFLPWRPVVVSPFSIRRFFSDWGYRVLVSELRYVWFPCALFALSCLSWRKMISKTAR